MSTVFTDLNPWGIYMCTPARFIKKRNNHAHQKVENVKESAELKYITNTE